MTPNELSMSLTLKQAFEAGKAFTLAGEQYTFMHIETNGRIKATHHDSGFRVSFHPGAIIDTAKKPEITLKPFIVLFTDDTFNVPEASLFHAESTEHAEEQFESENPNGVIVWVVETDNVDKAYLAYHQH